MKTACACGVSTYSNPSKQQVFNLTGVTTNSPSFNNIDFKGDLDTMSIDQWDYKQVGAFFGQTDGTTLRIGSSMRNTFCHFGDGSRLSFFSLFFYSLSRGPRSFMGWEL